MRTWAIQLNRVKAMSRASGLICAQIDATVQPVSAGEDSIPTTTLTFDEDTARVLLLLLKAQLAEFDARKAKSRR